jgi:SAM-dependent methyltransferase
MKLCLHCGTRRDAALKDCPACGAAEVVVNGFPAYAPDMAEQGGGFRPESFDLLATLEAGNFWFEVRNDIIEWAMRRYASDTRRLLEIGCGTGFVLSRLARTLPGARLLGTEIFAAGLPHAARRVPEVEFAQMDARRIPFVDEFDAIGAFDVIEHIEEDEAVLAEAHRALRPGGALILTVPQHPWLWSAADDFAVHHRRYTARELHHKLRAADFELVRSSSFVSLLLPAMALSRLRQRRMDADYDPADEMRMPAWLNRMMAACLRFELGAMKLGLSWPAGGSRLVVARKPAR